MKREVMITTLDNPFNPFVQFDEWLAYDTEKGYHTLNYLDRIAITSTELSEADQNLAIELAIDEIVKHNLIGLYRKVIQEQQ